MDGVWVWLISMFGKGGSFGARMEIVDEMSKTFQENRIDMKLISDAFREKWVFPKIGVPPKWMVKIMENPINPWMIWGENPQPTIFGNIQSAPCANSSDRTKAPESKGGWGDATCSFHRRLAVVKCSDSLVEIVSIKNWMGPNPNGPLRKLRSSY